MPASVKKDELRELKLIQSTIKNLRLALKNSVFYPPEHPIFSFSVNNFKNALDQWLQENDQFEIGFSKENLFLNGEQIDEKSGFSEEVANYLHMRGLLSLKFGRGIDNKELVEFFTVIRNDRKTIREQGGIVKQLSQHPHILIKEIDYSELLESPTVVGDETEEAQIWQFLIDIANKSNDEELPESKVKFLDDFFSDTDKSVQTLNKIYREAITEAHDEEAADEMRKVMQRICAYFDEKSKGKSKDLKFKLLNVISQLNPDLINILFEKSVDEDETLDLAEAITKDFSEGYIAEFIESLMTNEDTFNENLLKVFDKLAPNTEKSDNIVGMVADRLFSKRIINPETLTKMQMSIQEIFKRHPESNFMNQMYKITVDAVMNQKIDTLVYVARLTPLINKFVQSVEEDELKKEELWLLLNILWLENSADEFKKFSDKLSNLLPDLLNADDVELIKDIVEFFSEKTRPEQHRDKRMSREIKAGLDRITDNVTIHHLISLIPHAENKVIKHIAYILIKAESQSSKYLIDAYFEEKNSAFRSKYRLIIPLLRRGVIKEVIDRFEYCEPHWAKDLFDILRLCSEKKAHLVAKRMMIHSNPQVRWEAFKGFKPENTDEVEEVFDHFVKERNETVKKQAALILLETNNEEIVSRLFKYSQGGLFRRRFLLQLVELCGNVRSGLSLEYLSKIFHRKGLFQTSRQDRLRSAAVTSIARLQIQEAADIVKNALQDKSKRVRETAKLLLQIKEEPQG
ncbi:hypothetical protein JW835_12265 [bacterium]|nr:hypothetical protein [bacterium]